MKISTQLETMYDRSAIPDHVVKLLEPLGAPSAEQRAARVAAVVRSWTTPAPATGGVGWAHEAPSAASVGAKHHREHLEATIQHFGARPTPELEKVVEKIAADVRLDIGVRARAHMMALQKHAENVGAAAEDLLAAAAKAASQLRQASNPLGTQEIETRALSVLTAMTATSSTPKTLPRIEKAVNAAIESGDPGKLSAWVELLDGAIESCGGLEITKRGARIDLAQQLDRAVDEHRKPAHRAAHERLGQLGEWREQWEPIARMSVGLAADGGTGMSAWRALGTRLQLRDWNDAERQRAEVHAAAAKAGMTIGG